MPGIVLIIGAVLLLAGGVVAVLLLSGKNDEGAKSGLLRPERSGPQAPREPEQGDPAPLITKMLDRSGMSKKLQWGLLQAGLLVRPSELVALAGGLAAVGFIIGLLLHKLPVGLGLFVVGLILPFTYVNLRKGRRSKALVNQLAEALAMMASSLRSGYSFMRAMQVVRDEMDPPIAEEFGRVLDELNVGVSHERALKHLMDRCPNGDVELVVTACQIQANVGGNLAEVLDTTAEMIRERVRLQGEINALTAEGRLSAGILTAMPGLLGVIVSRISPGYMDPMFQTKAGLIMVAGAVLSTLMGLLVIKKLLEVDI